MLGVLEAWAPGSVGSPPSGGLGSWVASGAPAYEVLIPLSSCLMAKGQDRRGAQSLSCPQEGPRPLRSLEQVETEAPPARPTPLRPMASRGKGAQQ